MAGFLAISAFVRPDPLAFAKRRPRGTFWLEGTINVPSIARKHTVFGEDYYDSL